MAFLPKSAERIRLAMAVGLLTVFLGLGLASSTHAAEGWQAGTARTVITPTQNLWLAGFSNRTNPASGGKVMDLWVKALALQDASGHRAVILTADLLGIPRNIYEHTLALVARKYQLRPDQIMLGASHTHCGPVLRDALYDIYPLDERQRALIDQYSNWLESQMADTVGAALADLAPVRTASGQGTTGFAVNRRNNLENAVPELLAAGSLNGPVDHAVPVLAVYRPDGGLKAVLCGYACHNTTFAINEWCGDYAGYAQLDLEKCHPGAQAMFFMGCGGDQNPLPRHQTFLGERYGGMLAAAVEEVLVAPPHYLAPDLVTRMKMVTLPFGEPLSISQLKMMTNDPSPPTRRWAGRWLAFLEAGNIPPREYNFPMQAWRLGGQQLLITLGGEPVVDYAIKFKQAYGYQTWVAGYCNDVMCYLPSRRVLQEDLNPTLGAHWGYEGSYAFVVYGLPALRWADSVENLIAGGVGELVASTTAGNDTK